MYKLNKARANTMNTEAIQLENIQAMTEALANGLPWYSGLAAIGGVIVWVILWGMLIGSMIGAAGVFAYFVWCIRNWILGLGIFFLVLIALTTMI
jgi:hypothetical protein